MVSPEHTHKGAMLSGLRELYVTVIFKEEVMSWGKAQKELEGAEKGRSDVDPVLRYEFPKIINLIKWI